LGTKEVERKPFFLLVALVLATTRKELPSGVICEVLVVRHVSTYEGEANALTDNTHVVVFPVAGEVDDMLRYSLTLDFKEKQQMDMCERGR
jgi:hypothetical protein